MREKLYSSRISFFLGKLSFSSQKRVQSHWNSGALPPNNWWNIPLVRKRWNKKITGDENQSYIEHVANHYLIDKNNLCMLSIGCGTGSQEIEFWNTKKFATIDAIDIAANNIEYAKTRISDEGLHFIHNSFEIFKTTQQYDLILFHSSLHHLKNMEKVLIKVRGLLREGGILVIHEYTGPDRIQWNKKQLDIANSLLKNIPSEKRTYLSGNKKLKQTAPGLLRMLISDPSEAVESSSILPLLKKHFQPLELKGYGGNILVPVLKGISHHFVEENKENIRFLKFLFDKEDNFLKKESDDYYFGIWV